MHHYSKSRALDGSKERLKFKIEDKSWVSSNKKTTLSIGSAYIEFGDI